MTDRGRMHVAMVSANALPAMGGVETHIHEVSMRLADAGVTVTVLTTDRGGALPQLESRHGYVTRRWRAHPASRDYYLSPGLARHLRSASYDVVHVQGVHTLVAPTALIAARNAGIPAALTFHTGGHSSIARGRMRRLQWRMLKPLLRSAAALVAVSEHERDTFAPLLGDGQSPIRLIRNGCAALPVDPLAEVLDGEPLVVSVGRLERYKGHHRVLRALPALLEHAPAAKLVIVGSGPFERELLTMADRLGIAGSVTIRAYDPAQRGAMGKLVADADVFCLLSEYESHPVAVMEAIGAGTPALVANTSGFAELERSGLVTTIDIDASANKIAEAVLSLATSPRPQAAVLPSWDDCAAQLLDTYREVAR